MVDPQIEGLIANYELAFRMQSTMPQILDLGDESQETLDLYGIGMERTDNFGRQCLLARKFAEQGVRYIQVSTDYTWDHHQKVQKGHITECAKVDRPMAGLLQDLARRGLLDDTLVVWGAEFGRTPMVENGDGRNHHPQGFTVWMAGGGVKGGYTYGATDEFGYRPVEDPVCWIQARSASEWIMVFHRIHSLALRACIADAKKHVKRNFAIGASYTVCS